MPLLSLPPEIIQQIGHELYVSPSYTGARNEDAILSGLGPLHPNDGVRQEEFFDLVHLASSCTYLRRCLEHRIRESITFNRARKIVDVLAEPWLEDIKTVKLDIYAEEVDNEKAAYPDLEDLDMRTLYYDLFSRLTGLENLEVCLRDKGTHDVAFGLLETLDGEEEDEEGGRQYGDEGYFDDYEYYEEVIRDEVDNGEAGGGEPIRNSGYGDGGSERIDHDTPPLPEANDHTEPGADWGQYRCDWRTEDQTGSGKGNSLVANDSRSNLFNLLDLSGYGSDNDGDKKPWLPAPVEAFPSCIRRLKTLCFHFQGNFYYNPVPLVEPILERAGTLEHLIIHVAEGERCPSLEHLLSQVSGSLSTLVVSGRFHERIPAALDAIVKCHPDLHTLVWHSRPVTFQEEHDLEQLQGLSKLRLRFLNIWARLAPSGTPLYDATLRHLMDVCPSLRAVVFRGQEQWGIWATPGREGDQTALVLQEGDIVALLSAQGPIEPIVLETQPQQLVARLSLA